MFVTMPISWHSVCEDYFTNADDTIQYDMIRYINVRSKADEIIIVACITPVY